MPRDGHLKAGLPDVRQRAHHCGHFHVFLGRGRGQPHGARGVRDPGVPVQLGEETAALGSWCLQSSEPPSSPWGSRGPTLAFGDPAFQLSYLALVDGPVLGSASEDAHGKETAELILGLEGGRETWAERKRI